MSSPAAPLITVTVSADGTVCAIPGEEFGPEHMPYLADILAGVSAARDQLVPPGQTG